MSNNKTAGRWSPTSIGVNLAIVVFNVALMGAVWIAALEIMRTDREETINAAIDRNDHLAIVFEEYVKRTIESADAVIRYMIRDYLRSGSSFDIDQFAADHATEKKAFIDLILANENGNIATTAFRGKPAKPVNVTDREHFNVHLTQDSGKLFVGKPVFGRVSGKLVIPLTRRINKPDGSFGGVAIAMIEPTRFTDLLDDAKWKHLDIITLIGTDGIIRARLKGTTTTAGEDVSQSPVFKAYISRPNGHYIARGEVDGIAKFFSYRTLADYRLIALVAAAEGDVLANFFHRRRHYFGAAAIACVLIASFSLLLIVSLERQRRATASVARSQARFLATFDQAAVGIAHTDLDGRCLEANQKLCDITGYAREELLGRKFTDITHPDDVEDSNRFRRRVVRESNTFNSLQREKRYIRKDGSIVWCLLTTSVVRDKSGNIDYLAAVIQDITEQKKTEQARAQLAAIVESSNDAIISRNLDGTIASWNKAAERMFGWTATEIIGKPIQTLSPPDRRGNFVHVLEQVKRGEIAEPYDTERVRKDGTRFDARVSLSAVKDTAGHVTGIAIIIRDITESKRAETALRDYAAQMRHLSWRLSEVEERERRAIHRELHDRVGANLAALKLDLSLINSLLSSDDRKTAGDRLQKAQQLAGETVEQIRDVMADLRPPALDDYGLLAALRNYAQSYSARLGIPVMVDGDDIQPRLALAVETALFRIAQEALNNIAKHAQARHVVITITMKDNGVTLVIADDGIGFAPGQANPQRTVWGLRTMRERAQAIAADFRIESSPGSGTRIIIKLPRENA